MLSEQFYDFNLISERRRMPAWRNKLRGDADRVVRHQCDCILDYPGFPTDGHDYYSLARYYHPNPETPDGMPYVSCDGILNPESVRGPKSAIGRLSADVLCLGMAGMFLDVSYAHAAVRRLHKWFIDDTSAMNANLNHAQAKLGINNGSPCGTIDSHIWINIILGLELLERTVHAPEFFNGMRDWFGRYADWLYTSDMGRAAHDIGNNISAWWATQIMIYAGYSGNRDGMRDGCGRVYRDFIDSKMDETGCFFGELRRTRSLHYNLFCLMAMVIMATAGGDALWNYRGAHGYGIDHAIDFIVPFLTRVAPWPHPQIKNENFPPSPIFDIAARVLNRPDLVHVNTHLDGNTTWGSIGGPKWMYMPDFMHIA